jgi:hypothetical protein
VVVGGTLGLLAFVLALTLTLCFANTGFTERRAGMLAEANAISTAWLRAHTIGDLRGEAMAGLLEQYTHLRIDFIQAEDDPAKLDDTNRRTNVLQTEIRGHASVIVHERPDAVVFCLLASPPPAAR